MAEQYNDNYILGKIIDYKFTLNDLNSKVFPQLVSDYPLYCPFHANSHTGTKQARLYYDEERNIWYVHCYMEGKNFFAHNYVSQIMVKEKGLYSSLKEFLLTRLDKEEFENLYNLFKKRRDDEIVTQYERKCQWIDNVYAEKGNIIDYIETLYTA